MSLQRDEACWVWDAWAEGREVESHLRHHGWTANSRGPALTRDQVGMDRGDSQRGRAQSKPAPRHQVRVRVPWRRRVTQARVTCDARLKSVLFCCVCD